MAGLVSLSFDGTLAGHLELVVPRLDAVGFRGTFYADPATVLERIGGWREAAATGHEIGNGCLVLAAQPDGALPDWPLQTVADEIDVADALLADQFPGKERSFGFPWGLPTCGPGDDYRVAVKAHYEVARSGVEGHNIRGKTDFLYLRTILAHDMDALEIAQLVAPGVQGDEWVVVAFSGVGEGERAVDLAAFEGLVDHLTAVGAEVLPVVEAAHVWAASGQESFGLVGGQKGHKGVSGS